MFATLKLLNQYFWKTIYGPILAFIFPSLLLAILGNIMRIEYVLPGIVAMTTLFIAVQIMPLGLMEMKNSTLFKYIGSTLANPRKFIMVTIYFYVIINFLALASLMIFGAFLFYDKTILPNRHEGLYSGLSTFMGFFSFITSNSLHIILSLSIGIMIGIISKTPQQAFTISLIIIIPSLFLSGMVLSVDIIAQSKVMQWFSRFIPFRYTTGNIVVAMTPETQIGNLMDTISLDNKRLIFNITGFQTQTGSIKWLSIDHQKGLILSKNGKEFSFAKFSNLIKDKPNEVEWYNINSIVSFFPKMKIADKNEWFQSGDSTLFKEIFINHELPSADNNMFAWNKSFGVRKTPELESIKYFIKKYFRGDEKDSNNVTRFVFIYDKFIKEGKFSFLNIFIKQNIILYTLIERILNTLIPIIVIAVIYKVSIKKFNWLSR
ncbi:MAG: ABC transporter permease [Mycoplasma sp.]|nr:ABC transporter permease [Mycoplasma sp.]